ncbi:MAG: metalloregulator ArsR/SmtB family transcription factor [Coriobacteriia bacterium]|nr:metalloregulator ArsR/SmtB family transcription factor [Coriobacteriia bacterium]
MEEMTKCCAGDGPVLSDWTADVTVNHLDLDDMAALYKALGDRRRLYIVARIAREGDLCACKILADLDISQSTLSHHMRILTESGMVSGYRRGKWMHYVINQSGAKALRAFSNLFCVEG